MQAKEVSGWLTIGSKIKERWDHRTLDFWHHYPQSPRANRFHRVRARLAQASIQAAALTRCTNQALTTRKASTLDQRKTAVAASFYPTESAKPRSTRHDDDTLSSGARTSTAPTTNITYAEAQEQGDARIEHRFSRPPKRGNKPRNDVTPLPVCVIVTTHGNPTPNLHFEDSTQLDDHWHTPRGKENRSEHKPDDRLKNQSTPRTQEGSPGNIPKARPPCPGQPNRGCHSDEKSRDNTPQTGKPRDNKLAEGKQLVRKRNEPAKFTCQNSGSNWPTPNPLNSGRPWQAEHGHHGKCCRESSTLKRSRGRNPEETWEPRLRAHDTSLQPIWHNTTPHPPPSKRHQPALRF